MTILDFLTVAAQPVSHYGETAEALNVSLLVGQELQFLRKARLEDWTTLGLDALDEVDELLVQNATISAQVTSASSDGDDLTNAMDALAEAMNPNPAVEIEFSAPDLSDGLIFAFGGTVLAFTETPEGLTVRLHPSAADPAEELPPTGRVYTEERDFALTPDTFFRFFGE